jgi:hypothetical protein
VAEPRTWILTGSPENHAATAEHRTPAFQGRLRTVSEHDARVLLDATGARAGAGALTR